jgi:hypothetical protein
MVVTPGEEAPAPARRESTLRGGGGARLGCKSGRPAAGIIRGAATFSGEVADRHPPTGPTTDEAGVEQPGQEGVRLLTWGDPYLTAWLEAVRGEPLEEADYLAAGLAPGSNPLRQTRRERPRAATSANRARRSAAWA